MLSRPDRTLVLISGPIAAGKTTLAQGLAALARSQGLAAAAIDMDGMIGMLAGSDWSKVEDWHRRRACRGTYSLTQTFLDTGVNLVAIAGSTMSMYEWDEITRRLDPAPRIHYVLLRVSPEESTRRTQSDPGRSAAKEAEYVARLVSAIDWHEVRTHDIEVETDTLSALEVTALVAARVGLAQ